MTIIRIFRHRLAEIPRLARPIVDDQREVVRGDRGSDSGAAGLDGFDGGTCRRVLEDDAEVGELCVDFEEVREEAGFGIKDVGVLRRRS